VNAAFAAFGWQRKISIGLTYLKLEFYSLSNLSLKINELRGQSSCAIRRFPQSCAKANLGAVKINLTVGGVATASAVTIKGGGEQVNGREGKTATLYESRSLNLKLHGCGFTPRHLDRYFNPSAFHH